MSKQKKDFWDVSYNPVKGCNGPDGKHCPYCYGVRCARRGDYAHVVTDAEIAYLYGQHWPIDNKACKAYIELKQKIYDFKPHFFEYVYAQKLRMKPTMYFFSMSDPADWEQEWYEKIVEKIAENIQHTFVILTKRPRVYEKYNFPHNTILGVTITDNKILKKQMLLIDSIQRWGNNKILLSIEPIQEKIDFTILKKLDIDWIHVGGESGNRKDRVHATGEMIEPFFDLDIPVFMKDNLEPLFPGKLRKEYP